jgi:NAD(P)-dependent dehydrogenase (short-subunit alcohol dehydrogenase family)
MVGEPLLGRRERDLPFPRKQRPATGSIVEAGRIGRGHARGIHEDRPRRDTVVRGARGDDALGRDDAQPLRLHARAPQLLQADRHHEPSREQERVPQGCLEHDRRAGVVDYVSSKGGMIGFTRALAREVGAEGITVNAVTPGAILTEAELEMFPDQASIAAQMATLQSIPRRGLPEDIANGVMFLASDDASFITGQTLNIDGGWAMH